MNTTEQIVKVAIDGIQEKKGRGIKVIDISGMEGSICKAFVICEGGSPSQVDAITDSVEEMLRKQLGEKPVRIAGQENSIWVAMDYVDVMVHIFLPEAREFYALEDLWSDFPCTEIADLD